MNVEDKEIDYTVPENLDEKERIQWLLDKIFEIRRKQLMNFDALVEQNKKLDAGIEVAQKALTGATTKVEVMKWSAMVKSYSNRKQLCTERRLTIQRMHMEEARLEKEYIKLIQSMGD